MTKFGFVSQKLKIVDLFILIVDTTDLATTSITAFNIVSRRYRIRLQVRCDDSLRRHNLQRKEIRNIANTCFVSDFVTKINMPLRSK